MTGYWICEECREGWHTACAQFVATGHMVQTGGGLVKRRMVPEMRECQCPHRDKEKTSE